MRTPRVIRIDPPTLQASGAVQRVTASVDGVSVWYESEDLPLDASADGFASAFLLPAIAARAGLESVAALDPEWMGGAKRLVKVFHEWWGYPPLVPVAPLAARPGLPAASSAGVRQRALFFSGGVDSFHALLCCGESVDLLVFVQGFDIPVADSARAAAAQAMVREVAASVGIGCASVRTNLREHPLIRSVAWERSNGGALVSVGHMLSAAVSEMLIASSITVGRDKAWGSHWDTDPLFSSSRIHFRQIGQQLRRYEKIQVIAGETLPRDYLRVCWENRSPTGNCSKCGKCLVTRLGLAKCGALERFPVFAGGATLAADLDALPTDSHISSLVDMCDSPQLDLEVRRAARALLKRSRHVRTMPVRARRAVIRWLIERTRPAAS